MPAWRAGHLLLAVRIHPSLLPSLYRIRPIFSNQEGWPQTDPSTASRSQVRFSPLALALVASRAPLALLSPPSGSFPHERTLASSNDGLAHAWYTTRRLDVDVLRLGERSRPRRRCPLPCSFLVLPVASRPPPLPLLQHLPLPSQPTISMPRARSSSRGDDRKVRDAQGELGVFLEGTVWMTAIRAE